MNVVLTRHARERMQQRGISPAQVHSAFENILDLEEARDGCTKVISSRLTVIAQFNAGSAYVVTVY